MAKISFNALKSRCASLGFKLGRTEAGVYTITKHGDYGPAFDGEFNEVRIFMGGLEYERQDTAHNYVLLRKS